MDYLKKYQKYKDKYLRLQKGSSMIAVYGTEINAIDKWWDNREKLEHFIYASGGEMDTVEEDMSWFIPEYNRVSRELIKKKLLEEGESFKRNLVTKIKEDCYTTNYSLEFGSIPESWKKLINGEHSIDNFLELYSGYSREQWVDFMMELPIIVRLCLGV